MELENLSAKKKTEQRLRERQLELEQELLLQQEGLRLQQQKLQQQREQELRFKQQQQEEGLRVKKKQLEDELRLGQHERVLENEKKNTEANEEQRRMEIELKREVQGIWVRGRRLRRSWIRTQSRKNCRLGKLSGPTVRL